jgi:tetratricopeptide (TPR) repeat protein
MKKGWILLSGVILFNCSPRKETPPLLTAADSLNAIATLAYQTQEDSLYYEASLFAARLFDTSKALRYIDTAIKINPSHPNYHFTKGYYFYTLGHFQEALTSLKNALNLDSLNPKTLFYYGGCLSALNRHQDALLYFKKAIALDPYSPDYLFSFGYSLYSLQQYPEAKRYFLAALQMDSSHVKSIYLLIDTYFNLNFPDSAEIWINKLLEMDPLHPLARFQLGNLERDKALEAISQKKYAIARKHFQKAIQNYTYSLEKDSSFAEAYYRLGYTFFELGEYQKALANFQKAVLHNPLDFRAYFMIGSIYEYYGDKEEAIKYYELSLQRNAHFEEAKKALSELRRGK